MFEAVEDVETLQLCVHPAWLHPRIEEVSKRHYSPKAKGFVVRNFFSDNNTVYILGCSGASRCSGASPQGDTRGMLDYRPNFWGNIRAPCQSSRGPHAGRYIMIIDLGTSRGNQAFTSYKMV